MTEATPTKACVICAHPIPRQAIYCTQCENFQDGRWKARLGKETLPMLVALVAVLGALVGPIVQALDKKEAELVTAQIRNDRISVTNLGDVPGVVNSIAFEYNQADGTQVDPFGSLSLHILSDPVVGPGETKVFDLAFSGPQIELVRDVLVSPDAVTNCSIVVSTTAAKTRSVEKFDQSGCQFLILAALQKAIEGAVAALKANEAILDQLDATSLEKTNQSILEQLQTLEPMSLEPAKVQPIQPTSP